MVLVAKVVFVKLKLNVYTVQFVQMQCTHSQIQLYLPHHFTILNYSKCFIGSMLKFNLKINADYMRKYNL